METAVKIAGQELFLKMAKLVINVMYAQMIHLAFKEVQSALHVPRVNAGMEIAVRNALKINSQKPVQ
jgi:hypothetical protein